MDFIWFCISIFSRPSHEKISEPTSWNLQPYLQLGPPKNVSFKKVPNPTRFRQAEIFTKSDGNFPKKSQSFLREIPTKIEMLKWSWRCMAGCHKKRFKMIVRLLLRSKFTVTGNWILFFSRKLIQIFEGQIPSRRLLRQTLYRHASSCPTVFWHQMRLAETPAPKTCEVFKCLTLKLAKELIRRDTQAILA